MGNLHPSLVVLHHEIPYHYAPFQMQRIPAHKRV